MVKDDFHISAFFTDGEFSKIRSEEGQAFFRLCKLSSGHIQVVVLMRNSG